MSGRLSSRPDTDTPLRGVRMSGCPVLRDQHHHGPTELHRISWKADDEDSPERESGEEAWALDGDAP
jgi:hypothetical protein